MDFGEKLSWVFSSWRGIWDAFTLNLGTLVLVWLVPLVAFAIAFIFGGAAVVTSVASSSSHALNAGSVVFALVLLLAASVISVIFAPAYVILQLESAKGNKIDFKNTWDKSVQFILRYIGVYLLIFLALILPVIASALLLTIGIGFILLPLAFIFALAVGFFTMFVPYVLIDKNLSVSEAINQGYELAKQNWQWLVVVILVLMVVNFATSLIVWIPVIGFIASFIVSVASLYITGYVYVKQIAD